MKKFQPYCCIITIVIIALFINGCGTKGAVSSHPIKDLGQIEHVFNGPFLINKEGNVIMKKIESVYNENTINGNVRNDTVSIVQIDHLDKVIKVVRGRYNYFALRSNGEVWYWGDRLDNTNKGLFHSHPQVGKPAKLPNIDHVKDIWEYDFGFIFKKEDGSVWGWTTYLGSIPYFKYDGVPFGYEEDESEKEIPHELKWLRDVKEIGIELDALKEDGTVWESSEKSYHPIQGLRDIVAIDGGGNYRFALDKAGKVWTWGSINSEILRYDDNNKIANTNVTLDHPIMLQIDHVKKIGGGFAMKEDGSIWGLGSKLKLGTPQNIKEINGSYNEVVALSTNGKVFVGDQKGEVHEFIH